MGIKENDTTPPSSVDCFQGVRSSGFLKGKTGNIYSSESQVGKHSQVAEKEYAVGRARKVSTKVTGSNPVLTTKSTYYATHKNSVPG